jgi:diguanylate cyclase (GGDEF)-like protein
VTGAARRTIEYGIGVLLLVLILATGTLASPLLPLLVPWAALTAATRPARTTAPLASVMAFVLLVGELLADGIAVRDGVALGGTAAAAAVLVLWWRRREALHAHRLWELDSVLAEAARGEPLQPNATAASRLADLRRVLAEVRMRTGAARVTLWDVDATAERARPRASSERNSARSPVRLPGDPLGWVWSEGLPVRIDRTPAWAMDSTIVHAYRLDRGADGRSLVTFEFDPDAAPAAPAALEVVSHQLGAEVALHDHAAALASDRRRTAALIDTLRRIPAVTAPHEFASELLAGALDLADATGGAVALWREDAGRLLAVAGEDGGPAAGGEFGPLESEMALAARAGAELLRAPREPRGLPVAAPGELWLRPPRAVVALPLRTSHAVVGVLAVWTSLAQHFGEHALDLLRTLTPHAALQLEQALEYGRLRDTADRDPLTGLRNRRAFDRALADEATRLGRYGHPLALLVLDVDHFKSINDRFGHDAGDAVLQGLARIIESQIRDVDIAARFGGEEFVVLLPETALDAAAEVGERLRRAVESWELPWAGQALQVRVSIGASACPAAVTDPNVLVRSADTALYRAKREGRNRVVHAPAAG